MGTVLITVSAPGGRAQFAVPGDAEVAAIVPTLVRRCEPEPRPWSRWRLGSLAESPSHPG